MSGFLEKNLQILQSYDPKTADRLRQYTPCHRAEIIATPANVPSLRLQSGGAARLLHSAKNPIQEAQRWVNGLELPIAYNLMIFGSGLLYHVFELAKRCQRDLCNIVIVEREIDIVYAAFTYVDMTLLLQSRSFFFLIEPTDSEMRDCMNRLLTPFIQDGLTVIEHPASVEIDPAFYRRVREIVDESLQSGEILLRTKVQLGGMIQENIIRNIPQMLSNPSLTALNSALTKIPAFVVGAGPSLDKNVDLLAQVGDKGVIIAVDTVYKLLLNKGITPHLIATTDPTPLNARHFAGVTDLGAAILVFSPSVFHEIPKQLQGTKVSISLPSSRLLNVMKQLFGEGAAMSPGINVGQTCFNLARYLGCDPIVLVGFDLSFSRDGGSTHASGTALRRNIYRSDAPGKMKVELLGDKPELEEFDPIIVPANLGGEVATNKFWLAYLRSMEEEIKRTNARVINCTEGGAKMEGAEIRTLRETIQEYARYEAMAQSTLQMAVGFFFELNKESGKALLRQSGDILKTAVEKAEEGLQKVGALRAIASSRSPNPVLLEETMNEILKIHKALTQDHKVYAVLDEAADCVLSPFLKRENRPKGPEPTPKNVEMTIKRYQDYFSGMKELCAKYSLIIQETVDSMDNASWTAPSW
ncbi:MAG: 6-hydroxymethylpterin diphosphokinase MptE-like protein [Candidatus Omnitrophota bacterium]